MREVAGNSETLGFALLNFRHSLLGYETFGSVGQSENFTSLSQIFGSNTLRRPTETCS